MNSDLALRHRGAIYWTCQIAGWGAFFVVCTIWVQSFAIFNYRTVVFYFFLSVCGLLLTHAFRAFVRGRKWIELALGRLLPRVLAANLLMALGMLGLGFLYTAIAPLHANVEMHRDTTASIARIFSYFSNDFIILTLWTVIYFGVGYLERAQRAERDRYLWRTALAETELRGLKQQLNPHFLFNALNSLRALVIEDPPRAQSAVTQLAGILRYHLTSGERSLVPLEEELATTEQYLALELIRFEDRLSVVSEAEPRARLCLVPPLAVQALVENAIKHGLSRDAAPGRIVLRATLDEQQLSVVVGNTGTLQPNGAQNSTGLGLTNLRTRLGLLFGEEATLELLQVAPAWVEARLVLPARQNLEPSSP